ncbi:uncharacterized protein LOC132066109 [Lycium ferocissimum]|uniref:uncharacterized protein LOC132066109 n=1 Tax=Lycium ferocissimum TaxID=112874 RepID=UPI002814B373|nr:uncharacterized protein LOC132066109 [Lycium ferocissimum]
MPDNTDQTQVTNQPTAENTSSVTGNGINSNHPYFFHSSDSPGMSIVNTPFDGKGYQGWKRTVLIALSAKNKQGFISGAHPFPKEGSEDFTLGTDGNSNIAGYFTKLKRLWDELDSLNVHMICSCICICEGKEKLKKSLEDGRLMQFLMGLNDVFSQARGNILMMSPLPNNNHAYSLILQDENQREIYANPLISSDFSSFMVGSSSQAQFRNGKQLQKRLNGFPDDFQFTNTKTPQGPVRGNGVISVEESEVSTNADSDISFINQHLNKETALQIVQILKQVQLGDKTGSGSEINAIAIVDPFMKSPQAFGESREALYLPQPRAKSPSIQSSSVLSQRNVSSVSSNQSSSNDVSISSPVSVSFRVSASATSDVKLWHIRLGHLPFSSMKNFNFIPKSSVSDYFCDVCPLAK